MSSVCRLTASSGVEYVVRLVQHGDAYGLGGSLVNDGYAPLIEFLLPNGNGGRSVGVFSAREMPLVHAGWSPNSDPSLALPGGELDRLHAWIDDPSSVNEDGIAVLVGCDDALAKVAVALQRIGLEPRRVPDAGRMLAMSHLIPPALVVVGEDPLHFDQLDVVRRLRAAPETSEVAIVVLGGDRAAAQEAGATLFEPMPPDYAGLPGRIAGLLDFV